jgi:hypothetical protein
MKNVWLHGIYLSLIGILAFQLYSTIKARDLAFGQVEQVLNNNFHILEADSKSLCETIEKQSATNFMLYEQHRNSERQVKEVSKAALNSISKYLGDVLSGKKLSEKAIRDDLKSFSLSASYSVSDLRDRFEIIKKCYLNKLIENDTFWKIFNQNPNTNLLLLKNQIVLDEVIYLNYLLDKVSGRTDFTFDKYILIISPKQAVLIEDEIFEADFSLAKYSINPGQGLTFSVNNQTIKIKDGVGHFKKKENTIGLKTIHAQASIRNPATGETTTVANEFQYHVLPKCSQNCQ